MSHPRVGMLAVAALLLAASASGADPPSRSKGPPSPDTALGRDAQALAAKIDEHIAAGWSAAQAEPAPLADDAEFLRRVYLDLAGRIPSVAEARDFLKDQTPGKRQRLVERLVIGPRYVTHFTNVWRALMLPEATASLQTRLQVPEFEAWLRKQLAQNAGYDQIAKELLTTPIGPGAGAFRGFGGGGQGPPTAVGFYLAKELKPEELAASTSRLFLGFKLECAQCHNHPFASWKRDQFWSYAAFFASVEGRRQGQFTLPGQEKPERRELTIPGTDKVVKAKFLDGKDPVWKPDATPRATLADWMTAADNPYFAKAAVNRLWAYFFGTGLIDPVDEMVGSDNTASHPELLDELARELAAHQFDLKFLVRAITASRAYQLSSAATHKSQDDPRLFARMAVKGLSAEQLFDSLAQATGYQPSAAPVNPRALVLGAGNPTRTEFLTKFANQSDKSTEVQTSILQALALMNGRFIADATSLERSETLAALVDAPFLDTAGRIEALYLATLSRKPRPKEIERLVKYVEKGGATEGASGRHEPADAGKEKQYNQALADVFWALLNSGEFFLNH